MSETKLMESILYGLSAGLRIVFQEAPPHQPTVAFVVIVADMRSRTSHVGLIPKAQSEEYHWAIVAMLDDLIYREVQYRDDADSYEETNGTPGSIIHQSFTKPVDIEIED